MEFSVFVAGPEHVPYAQAICDLIESSAKARGTGIAKRDPHYIASKMLDGRAVIGLNGEELAGFCYIRIN